MAAFQQNQLQFNLGVPSHPENVAFRKHRPTPIVIEKRATGPPVGASNTGVNVQQNIGHPNTGLNSSSVSNDRMSVALKLAQRDIKKRKEQERMQAMTSRNRSPSPKSKTKPIPGQKFWGRQLRSRDPKKERRVLTVREHDRNRHPKDSRTQTPPRAPKFGGRVPDPNFPATSQSPPTKDTDLKIYPIQKGAPSDQPAKEIERLQREMESYLQQIQVIEQRALREHSMDFLQNKSRKRQGYLPDEEDSDRKQVRNDEQQTRATRQLYVLRQQVREIQNQVIRTGPDNMKHTKKSETMLRLAAAHRGAVRAIQSFVNNLPHADLRKGLPTSYQELALLVRQMSLLSNQLSTDGQSTVHDDLLSMLDRVDELNKAWCAEVQTEQQQTQIEQREKSPASRPPFEVPKPVRQPPKPVFVSYKGKENKAMKGVLKKPNKFMRRQHTGSTVTPERKATLQAGIAALLQEDKPVKGGLAWAIPTTQQPAHKKSLIIPGRLQAKRRKAQKLTDHAPPKTHYADPTVASQLKVASPREHGTVLERSFSAPPSPRGYNLSTDKFLHGVWKPAGKSPTNRRTRSQSPTTSRGYLASQDLDGSIVQTLFQESQSGQAHSVADLQQRGRSPTRSRQMQRYGSPDRLLTEAELAIRMKLKPLLEQADKIAKRQEQLLATKDVSARQKLADKAYQNVETNGDILSDMLLDEIIGETVQELQSMEQSQKATQEAIRIQDNPTLENIFNRLEQMEQEQFEIRRRWATLEFEEEGSNLRSNKYKEGHLQDLRPTAPTAMEITRDSGPSITGQKNLYTEEYREDEPIIFTKFKPATKFQEQRVPQEECPNVFGGRKGPVEMSLPKNVVENIQNHVEKFERHLKKTLHQSQGTFDPWKLAEEVSEQILEDCMNEIAEELEDVNEAVVNQVCKSEFMINNSVNSSQTSPGYSPATTPYGASVHSPVAASHGTSICSPVGSPHGASVRSPALSPHHALMHSPVAGPSVFPLTSPDAASKMVAFSYHDNNVSEQEQTESEDITYDEDDDDEDDEDDYEDDI